jgi:2-polyprenyl-3-methyl-5-hydroxy-6-metoxy-1,4-benzoquinol methylase
MHSTLDICKKIIEENKEFLLNRRVLEIAPMDGWFTEEILKFSEKVSVVEYDPKSCLTLRNVFDNRIKLFKEDAHEFVRKSGLEFETVVVYGFLYHSHSPLSVIEDIVNNISPDCVLLETWESNTPIAIKDEIINERGHLWVKKKTCKLSITINEEYYKKALSNLGYRLVKKFNIADFFRVQQGNFKHGGIYMTFVKDN